MQMQMMYMNKFILANSQFLGIRVISIKRMHIIKVYSPVRKLRDGEAQKLYTNAFFDQFNVFSFHFRSRICTVRKFFLRKYAQRNALPPEFGQLLLLGGQDSRRHSQLRFTGRRNLR
jgi:hypothetical protein